jgi:23S rRNA (adenine2503-C2)-methyltransferase
VTAHPSEDGSTKYVFTLYDGAKIESVYMPRGAYRTLCISSQVGCALGCTFCATGAIGFKRNLSAGEILGQVIHMRCMHPEEGGQPGRWNVVFMGMGEPLHNLANLMRAFDSLTHPHGMVLSQKDVAVSTAGLVPKICELAKHSPRPRLMVSIAATSNQERSAVMPVNRAYPLEILLETLENFPLQHRERIMLSYVLIAGVNDRDEDAERLITMSRRFPSLVNLIPMNAHAASPGMDEPEEAHLLRFARLLRDAGVFATIRHSRGRDVAAACGQLAAS